MRLQKFYGPFLLTIYSHIIHRSNHAQHDLDIVKHAQRPTKSHLLVVLKVLFAKKNARH